MPSSSKAISGHGAQVAIEKFGDPAGQFTVVAELTGDVKRPELTRPEVEVTPHNDDIDTWVLSVLTRTPLTFTNNFIYNDPTHDASFGFQKLLAVNQIFGVRVRGPNGVAGANEMILSAQVQKLGVIDKIKGVEEMAVTIRPHGYMIIDGLPYPHA
jgi:hypothetical protein